MGIWVKGDSELNTSEPVVTEPTSYLSLGPAEGPPASLETQAEVYETLCAEVTMCPHTSRCPHPPLLASAPSFLPCLIYACA